MKTYYIKEEVCFIDNVCKTQYEVLVDYGKILNFIIDCFSLFSYADFRRAVSTRFDSRKAAENAMNEYIKYKNGGKE